MFERLFSLPLVSNRSRDNKAASCLPIKCSEIELSLSGQKLIRGLNLTLETGKVSIVMGPNGSGKSLLLRLLHGLVNADAGEITCAGDTLAAAHVRQQAMVFQRPVLLRRSVAANLDFAMKLRGTPDIVYREQLLTLVGLQGRNKHAARSLSGGEQQRLALARALSFRPQVLFLDEPTANLDPSSTHMIEEIVRQAHLGGTKIVFVSHDIGQARRLGDEVIFINHGQVIEQQPATEFFSRPISTQAADYLQGRLVF